MSILPEHLRSRFVIDDAGRILESAHRPNLTADIYVGLAQQTCQFPYRDSLGISNVMRLVLRD
jgi:hypothetical protein